MMLTTADLPAALRPDPTGRECDICGCTHPNGACAWCQVAASTAQGAV